MILSQSFSVMLHHKSSTFVPKPILIIDGMNCDVKALQATSSHIKYVSGNLGELPRVTEWEN